MSIVTITTKSISGALNTVQAPTEEIRVGKDKKALVIMEGYIGANRVKADNGTDYVASAYGRLPVKAAKTGEGDKERLVLDIAGGLRGVLFRNTKKDDANDADYTGNVTAGDGNEFPIFGRKVLTENGSFIALSSMERKPVKDRSADVPAGQEDDSIPF